MASTPAGYSGTPLVKKLGFKEAMTIHLVNAPPDYTAWLAPLPDVVTFVTHAPKTIEATHLFLTKRSDLEAHLTRLRGTLTQTGFIWISWPKKSSKVETDITEDTIREVALPMGFVDIKVCAVSEIWSGLKLVIRKSERK